MPYLKLPPFGVVTFHRSTEAKARGGTAKDRVLEGLGPQDIPLRESQPKPRVEFRPLTPDAQYPSPSAVRRAMQKLPGVETEDALVDFAISNFAGRTIPRVALMPEAHGVAASFAWAFSMLVLLAEFAPGPKILLVERTPHSVARIGPVLDRVDENLQRDRPVLEGIGHANPSTGQTASRWDAGSASRLTLMAFARRLGFEVRGFDPEQRTGRSLDEREASMLHATITTLPDAATMFALPGASHAGPLHRALSGAFDTWVAGPLFEFTVPDGDTIVAKCFSYLLAKQKEMTLVRAVDSSLTKLVESDDIYRLIRLVQDKVASSPAIAAMRPLAES